MIALAPRTRRWFNVAAVLLSTSLLVVLFRTVPLAALWRFVRAADIRWLLGALASNVMILVCWSQQWRMLLPLITPIPTQRLLALVAQTAFLGSVLPVSGPASAVVLLMQEPGVTQASAVSVVSLDQLVEGLARVGLLLVASQFVPLTPWMRVVRIALPIVVVTALLVLTYLSRQRRWLYGWMRAFDSLRDLTRFGRAFGWCLCSKSCEALAIFAVQRASGVMMSPGNALLVLAAVSLATMIPVAPGNLGTYEASAVAMYRQLGVNAETALGLAVVQHLSLLLGTVGVGYVQFALRRFRAVTAA